jgi:hypothetical protein
MLACIALYSIKKQYGKYPSEKIKLYTTLYKKVVDFPIPSRDVTNQTLPGWEY